MVSAEALKLDGFGTQNRRAAGATRRLKVRRYPAQYGERTGRTGGRAGAGGRHHLLKIDRYA
jgi:hypothetical protein